MAASTWGQFLRLITQNSDGSWLFRGHAQKDWQLIPSIGRSDTWGAGKSYIHDEEIELFEDFKRGAVTWETGAKTDLEWLAIAQHFGLPTRLLDWSYNPLVAAWFACKADPAVDGQVHFVRAIPPLTLRKDYGPANPVDIPTGVVELVSVPPRASRITAQKGVFSLHPNPTIAWDPDAAGHDHGTHLIPADEKAEYLTYLHLLGVDEGRLMVDLQSFCANLAYEFRRRP